MEQGDKVQEGHCTQERPCSLARGGACSRWQCGGIGPQDALSSALHARELICCVTRPWLMALSGTGNVTECLSEREWPGRRRVAAARGGSGAWAPHTVPAWPHTYGLPAICPQS